MGRKITAVYLNSEKQKCCQQLFIKHLSGVQHNVNALYLILLEVGT